MAHAVQIGERLIGLGEPCYIVAEIGINHNGEVAVAERLIDAATDAGCDAVKFQKRDPQRSVPASERDRPRDTPWGTITYLDYRNRLELVHDDYVRVQKRCLERDTAWFASCWDEPSVDFIEQFEPPCYKIASACLTDHALLRHHRRYGRPMIVSTGMSSLDEIDRAVDVLGTDDLVLMHTTSSYPAQPEELNLLAIQMLAERYGVPVGYSGHEVGLQTTLAAVALGACIVERHITLDRAMWGTDQAASVEPHGFARLVRDIRTFEIARGDGVKRVYETELPVRAKLRRIR